MSTRYMATDKHYICFLHREPLGLLLSSWFVAIKLTHYKSCPRLHPLGRSDPRIDPIRDALFRNQLDIFLFKRFYEDVRCKLNDLVKRDYSLALLDSGVCTNRLRRFSNLA